MKKFMDGYQKVGEIGLDLFILNFYWIVFTLLGGILFGTFPATVSLYASIRQKLTYGRYEDKLYKVFWKYYKTEFVKSNKLGFIVYLISFILYLDFRILGLFNMGLMGVVAMTVLAILSIVFVLMLIYLIPVYVQFEGTIFQYVKRSFILIIGKPKETSVSLLLLILLIIVYYNIPGFIPVFGISIYAFISFRIVLVDVFNLENLSNRKIKTTL